MRNLLAIFTMLTLSLCPRPALAQGNAGNPKVLPPGAHAYGKTYGEWSAEWWKWTYSMPLAHHPLSDTADCSTGQKGHVWFLGGTYSPGIEEDGVLVGRAERDCNVPSGTPLFFPVLNTATYFDGDYTVQPGPCSLEENLYCDVAWMHEYVRWVADHAGSMTATIDGKPVSGLFNAPTPYRVQSPVFSVTPVPGSLAGDSVKGTVSPVVADGVFLMLAPLSVGAHTLHLAGQFVFTEAEDGFDYRFALDVTYHLNVKPAGR